MISVDLSSSLGQLNTISSMSEDKFLEDFNEQSILIQKLFDTLQLAISTDSDAKSTLQKVKWRIKTIQNRIQEATVDPKAKDETLSKISQLLLSLKTNKTLGHPPIVISPEILTFVDINKALFEAVWKQKDAEVAKAYGGGLLTFSDLLKDKIDDSQLELLLKHSPPFALDSVTHFDFTRYQKLSPKAVMLLVNKCPNIQRMAFQGISSLQFCDHVLLIDGKKIHINKEFVSHYSPFFKGLFDFEGITDNKKNETELKEVDFSAVQDCINAMIRRYEIHGERDINRALACLNMQLFFQLTDFVDDSERTVIGILYEIQQDDPENLEEILCAINQQFYLHFNEQKLSLFAERLGAMGQAILLKKISEQIGDVESIGLDLFKTKLLTLLEELYEKKFPCYGLVQVLKDDLKISTESLFMLRKKEVRLLEKLHIVDPFDSLCKLSLAIAYKSDIWKADRYQKIQKLLESVISDRSENLRDIACVYLSDLLQTETDAYKPDVAAAKKILQKMTGCFSENNISLSEIAMTQLLIEENSQESLKEGYDLLMRGVLRRYQIELSLGVKERVRTIHEDLVIKYFQFLLVQRGFHGSKGGYHNIFFLNKIFEKEKPLLTGSRMLLEAICKMGGYLSAGMEEFEKDIEDDTKIENIMATIDHSPFSLLAKQMMKVAECHK